MQPAVFERFREIIYHKSGIVLSPEKMSLLASRIQKRIRESGLKNEAEYLEIIEVDLDGSELVKLIDAISTNTTYFWREPEHFKALGDILDGYNSVKKEKTRIWCAAASSGQEPYILGMEVLEHLPPTRFDVKILATDVSTKVLKIAQAGIYSDDEVSKLPADKRTRFLEKLQGKEPSNTTNWSVCSALRELVLFKQLNLVEQPYPLKGPIDIIFCRNVMIYFDLKTRQSIIDQFKRLLAPGGYLFLSLSESLLGIEHHFRKVGSSIYRKED